MSYRCGYVALLGAPNAGKSTLLNTFLGDKIAIVTAKPQTTRDNIQGILTLSNAQLIFVDTPGLHSTGKKFNQMMVDRALSAMKDADVAYFVVDSQKGIAAQWESFFREILADINIPVFLVLNKADLVSAQILQEREKKYEKWRGFDFVAHTSALYSQTLHGLLKKTLDCLPLSPPLYPQDMISDTTERFFVREIIREKLFEFLHDELPYSCAVQVEEFREQDERKDFIYAVIVVENQSQKKIVVGKKGEKLKKIGSLARHEIEETLGRKVFLELWVKVKKNWTKNPRFLKELGYWNGKL